MTHQKRAVKLLIVSIACTLPIFTTASLRLGQQAANNVSAAEPRPSIHNDGRGLEPKSLAAPPLPDEINRLQAGMPDPAGKGTAVRRTSAELVPAAPEAVLTPERPRLMANIPSKTDGSLLRELQPRHAPAPVAAASGLPAWQEPKLLLDKLGELNSADAAGRWAAETTRLLHELGAAMSKGPSDTRVILDRLEKSAAQGTTLAASLHDQPTARKVRQAIHALTRRLAIWSDIAAMGTQASPESALAKADPHQLSLCLSEVESLIGDSFEARAWRKYLLLDALRECSNRPSANGSGVMEDLAREALLRMTKAPLSADQRFFISSGPVAALRTELRRLTAEPVSSATLLEHLEQYEQSRQSADALLLARDYQSLNVSRDKQCRELGQQIELNYRNANLRLAVSGELLNRLMPKRTPEAAPVYDSVLGVPVRGRSLTSTQLAIKLLPDASRVRLALEATGQVDSVTNATSGPATFYNRGTAYYTARKAMELDLRGIRLDSTDVDVQNHVQLQGVETDFDGVPLIGPLANRIARTQHEMSRDAADREVRAKVAYQARRRIDAEATAQLTNFAHRFQGRVLAPLYNLALEPMMIGAETTDQRLVMRIRLAGDEQVGSHTPRPEAPGDSLASVQTHESAINNALENLNLDGRTLTLPELSKHVANRFCLPEPWDVDPENGDVMITFAAHDAIRVQCQDGQMILTMALARLSKGRTHWKDFQARVFFRPQANGLSAELVRNGTIHLIGPRLGVTSRIALQGVFEKTFPRKTNWNLMPDRLLTSPELASAAITQFVIDDGWIGVALGPKPATSTARQAPPRPSLLRR